MLSKENNEGLRKEEQQEEKAIEPSSGKENGKKRLKFRLFGKKPKKESFSIAFQMSVEQIRGRLFSWLAADILYAFLMISALIYNTETAYLGRFRDLGCVSFRFGSGSFSQKLSESELHVTLADGSVAHAPVGGFANFLFYSLIIILIIQFIIFVAACFVIPGRIYKRLEPLSNMTDAAQALKNIDINGDPDSADSFEIHTGKEELAGLEEAVNDLLRRSRESYQSQIRFVSDASHELRTPIAVIKGYVNMLDRWGREDKEVLDESIESIKSEAENMSRLVENLLFLARGDSGRAVIRFEKTDLNSLICEIYDEFVMIDKTHNFRLDLRADITDTVDPSLIKQCLRILVDNAVKYSPEGKDIILRIQEHDADRYSICVQDNGIGIKQEEAGKIFDRFYRSDPARNRSSGGYGLGLSIAKWIADKHGGYFEVLSYENLGSRISLVLPRKEKQISAEDENGDEKRQ